MSEENQKFIVLHVVRYSFDTQKEADDFVDFMECHCDGFFVHKMIEEDIKNEQK